MKRREFVALLGGAVVAWPVAARAQQPTKSYRIGMLETISASLNAAHLDAFRKGLRELGYVEGKNYTIEYRSADGHAERFPELAADWFGSGSTSSRSEERRARSPPRMRPGRFLSSWRRLAIRF
jgi:putative tryptophan/tyrosine transport system substrate-binding protein